MKVYVGDRIDYDEEGYAIIGTPNKLKNEEAIKALADVFEKYDVGVYADHSILYLEIGSDRYELEAGCLESGHFTNELILSKKEPR